MTSLESSESQGGFCLFLQPLVQALTSSDAYTQSICNFAAIYFSQPPFTINFHSFASSRMHSVVLRGRVRRLGSEGGRPVLRPVSGQFCLYLHKLRFINETQSFWNSGHAFHYFYEWCFLKKTSIKYYNNCLSWKVNVFLEKKFTGTILYKQHQIMKNDFSSRE